MHIPYGGQDNMKSVESAEAGREARGIGENRSCFWRKGGPMIVEENVKLRTEKGEIRAFLLDAKFVCAECYRLTDPNLERVSKLVCFTDGDIDEAPKSVRSLLFFCDVCKRVFAHPSKEDADETSEASAQILTRQDALDKLFEIIYGDRRAHETRKT
jgi:hypothetical protein